MIPSKLLPLSAFLLFLVVLTSCSSTTNTISGLSTLQSTISGSNYVFFVDPETGRLVSHLDILRAGERIRAGDYFSVYLDFGFVRYLQAVDPYVIVYSETWMGNKPRPTDSEKTLRQVVLLKEGMAPNARLPLTSIPLLGPVTMGDDLLDVYVTLKVVVLSKKDNEQTIQLVEGLAGQAAASAPQFSAVAGATAATVAAFIAQNRDKVEFEHTFAFAPEGFVSEGVKTSPFFSHTVLREGQVVVIKGESRFRAIPYPNWYYYLYPFNWFGLSPDGASRRFESDEAPTYTPIGEIIRIPASAIGSLFSDARSDTSFWRFLFPVVPDPPPTSPRMMGLDGYNLVKCNHDNASDGRMNSSKKDIEQGTDATKVQHQSNSSKSGSVAQLDCRLTSKGENESSEEKGGIGGIGENLKSLGKYVPIIGAFVFNEPPSNIYSEKTHIVIRVHKTKGTLGTFDELLSHFSEHAATINEVTTSSSEARRISREKIGATFESVKKAVLYDRAKQQIRDEAKRGIVKEPDLADVNEHDRKSLRKLNIKEHVYYTERKLLNHAKDFGEGEDAFGKVIADIQSVKNISWNLSGIETGQQKEWKEGWKLVLDNVRNVLSRSGQFRQNFPSKEWDKLVFTEDGESPSPSPQAPQAPNVPEEPAPK